MTTPDPKLQAETERRFAAALLLSGLPSYNEWARVAGVSRNFIFVTKSLRNIPNIRTAIRVAKAANTTVEALWGHIVEEPPRIGKRKKKSPAVAATGENETTTHTKGETASEDSEG